jgi:hypothetical protein
MEGADKDGVTPTLIELNIDTFPTTPPNPVPPLLFQNMTPGTIPSTAFALFPAVNCPQYAYELAA